MGHRDGRGGCQGPALMRGEAAHERGAGWLGDTSIRGSYFGFAAAVAGGATCAAASGDVGIALVTSANRVVS